ncbi:MAG: SPFH domain-containing protein [Polyangiaceae bacterium]|nr:SPFH domain-containing protein [Polyangiaceae bacterium]
MGILDFVKGGVKEMMIARPDDKKQLIVYKHPDQNIPFWSQLTVDSDEAAVFFKDGRVVGILGPGRHTLQSQNIPFLNNLVKQFTGGDVFIAEIFFVKTQPVRDIPFGGPIGMMIDPLTSEMCTPRMFGKFSLVVTEPMRFVVGYVGQAAAGNNDQTLDWIKGLFFLGVKTVIGELCETENKSIIQAVALTQVLAQRFVERAPNLDDIGVRVLQMGNFSINFDEEEKKRLIEAQAEVAKAQRGVRVARAEAEARQHKLDQDFNQEARYVQHVAGNWQNYAGGRAMIGAGEGMSKGGSNSGVAAVGAQMAMGMGMANMMANQARPQGPQYPQPNMPPPQGQYGQPPVYPQAAAPSPAGGIATCPKCAASVAPGRFCAECGAQLTAPAKKFCSGCGTELAATARFCANCGTPAA